MAMSNSDHAKTRTHQVHPRTVYVSDALQARLDTYRDQDATRSTTSVVFEAVERLAADIPELVRASRARPVSPFAPHSRDVTYLGSGPVQIQIQPSWAQTDLLDKLSAKLDMPLETWMPPLLNAYLPGRKEPDNMPWLTRERPEPTAR